MSEYKSRINIQVKNVSDWEKLFDIKMKEEWGLGEDAKKVFKVPYSKKQTEFIKAEDREAGALLHKHRGRWKVCPVEYKHGKDKLDDSDKLQLCCEAMCLEEMLACHIQHGYLYYHEIRRRRQIDFTPELREKVKAIAEEMHQYFRRRHIPRVKPQKCCKSCSLKEMCLPKLLRNISVKDYYHKMLRGSGV